MRGVIHVLTGCTAVGKTEYALRWAEEHGAEILSCDSLLFYRGMDIGTAKPTAAERGRIPHHLIDILDLSERMDVARYVSLARQAAEEIIGRGRQVLVAGGSGFYLKSFFKPVADSIAVPATVRQAVAALPAEAALEELRRLDPEGLARIDAANPRRVARALERRLASGRPLAELAASFAAQSSAFADWDIRLEVLERPAAELEQRIERRVGAMLEAGLMDEVRRLLSAGLRENPSAARAIGYRECLAVLDGELEPGDLRAVIIGNTRALVKKQRTWFRTQLPTGVAGRPSFAKVADTRRDALG